MCPLPRANDLIAIRELGIRAGQREANRRLIVSALCYSPGHSPGPAMKVARSVLVLSVLSSTPMAPRGSVGAMGTFV